MKKKMLFVMATLVAFTLFVPSVIAAEIVAKIGEEEYETLAQAITEAEDGDTIELVSNVVLTEKLSVSKDITLDGGNNYTITSSAAKIFEIYGSASDTTVVTFKNVEMVTSASDGRCVDTRTGSIELTLNNVTLKTTSSDTNNQPLTVGGNAYAEGEANNKITLVDTTIDAGKAGYGIIVFNPITLTINTSNIVGYSALYFKGDTNLSNGVKNGSLGSAGSVVTVVDSTLTSNNVYSGSSNNFGTVAFEDDNISMTIKDSEVVANSTVSALNAAFSLNSTIEVVTANKVEVSGESQITVNVDVDDEDATEEVVRNNVTVVLYPGVTSNVSDISDYLAEGTEVEKDEDGNLVVVIPQVNLTMCEVIDGKVGECEIISVDKGLLIDKDVFEKELTDTLKEENKYLYDATYADKELKNKFDFTKSLDVDTEMYVSVTKNPKTGDINLAALIGTILVGLVGIAIILRKRFAKVN